MSCCKNCLFISKYGDEPPKTSCRNPSCGCHPATTFEMPNEEQKERLKGMFTPGGTMEDRFLREYEKLTGMNYGACQECGIGQAHDILPFIRTEAEEAHGQGLIDGSRFMAKMVLKALDDLKSRIGGA